jgi:putative transposase
MYQLRKDQNIRIDGTKFTCVRKLAGKMGWSLINAETFEPKVMTVDEFLDGYSTARIDFLTDADVRPTDGQFNPMVADITAIPEEPMHEARRRKTYVVACQMLGRERTAKKMKDIVRQTAEKLGEEKAPHISTVYDWIGLFERADGDIRSLLPRTYKRGPRAKQLSNDTFVVINNMTKAKYLRIPRISAEKLHRLVVDEVNQMNDERTLDRQIDVPSLSTVKRYIAGLDPYEVRVARYGRKKADTWYRVYKKGVVTDRILERVEVDHTLLDIIVKCAHSGVILGRPTLTVAIDHRSRSVLGFYLGFEVPSSMSIAHCLHHAFSPKTYVKTAYPDIKNDWHCYGLPETLVFDNGLDFLSAAITNICETLNVDIHYMPGGQPHYKGVVERFFRTIQDALIHRLDGTTFSNTKERGDYKADENACITIEKLLELIHHWIIDIYHQDIHSTINDTPANAWQTSADELPPPNLAKSQEHLKPLLGGFDLKAISNSGVLVNSLKYNDPEILQTLLRQPNAPKRWQVRFNPSNLGAIEILDPVTLTYYAIPAVDGEYASRQTLYRHNIHKRMNAARRERVTNVRELCRSERVLEDKIEAERQKTKEGKRVKGVDGINVPRYSKTAVQQVGSDDYAMFAAPTHSESSTPTTTSDTQKKKRSGIKAEEESAVTTLTPDSTEISQLLDDSSSEFNKEFSY